MMTGLPDAAAAESLTQVFYDIAQLLESADDSEARVRRVLTRLASLVPYQRCAVLDAPSGMEPRLLTTPGTLTGDEAELAAATLALLRQLVEHPARSAAQRPPSDAHLAVPLIGLDQVVGVLFVDRADGVYDEQHLRALSVVAAKLAAYFSMLHAFQRETARAEQLLQAQHAAAAADRAKDEFLALVSHELRSPLNSILTWADALVSKDTADTERARAGEAIERAVRTQAKLVADLLDLACTAARTLRLDLRDVEPAQLINEAIITLRPQAELKRIQLEVKLDESVTPLVADPHRLSQVVVSLIANAIKFTPPGGHVEVRLERADELARLRVVDSGPGIDARVLPRIFEPFTQQDSSTTRVHGGLGVGLALVKDLVELHGGTVRADSVREQLGATFTVELPFGPVVRPAPILPLAVLDDRRGGALAGVRVLIVDDDRDIGEVLQFVLEAQGALVSVALSAAEALAVMSQELPDVLLSDIAMPGDSGYQLMRAIVAREGENAPLAAALSAHAPGHDLKEALAAGFRMLLAKPIDAQTLISAIAVLAVEARNKSRARLGVEEAVR
jgi:signal transduction histidine kinase/ActR/RegA family two-component response regulator